MKHEHLLPTFSSQLTRRIVLSAVERLKDMKNREIAKTRTLKELKKTISLGKEQMNISGGGTYVSGSSSAGFVVRVPNLGFAANS
ncbi:MAG: hypothetical protein AB7V06_15780 [Candidatus Obscuribacterales bacterium]